LKISFISRHRYLVCQLWSPFGSSFCERYTFIAKVLISILAFCQLIFTTAYFNCELS